MMPLIVLFGAQNSDDYVEWLITSVKSWEMKIDIWIFICISSIAYSLRIKPHEYHDSVKHYI